MDKTLGERIKGGFSKTGEKISDGWITTKLNWFFVGEDLRPAGRTRAVELAKATEGVKTVVNQLTIHTSAQ